MAIEPQDIALWKEMASSLISEKLYDEAEESLNRAIRSQPTDIDFQILLMWLHYYLGRRKALETTCQQVISWKTLSPFDRAKLADFMEEVELSGAASQYRKAIQSKPDNPDLQLNFARFLVRTRNRLNASKTNDPSEVLNPPLVEAKISLQMCLELDPEYLEAHLELARIWYLEASENMNSISTDELRNKAVEACQHCLELFPRNAEAHRLLGDIHYRLLNSYSTAIEHYSRACGNKPDYHNARAMIGWSCLGLEDPLSAQKIFETVLKDDPENKLALKGMDRI